MKAMRFVMKFSAKVILSVALLAAFAMPALATSSVLAASPKAEICQGLGQVSGSCSGGSSDINHALKSAINILSFVAGVVAIIMIIISGLKFITAQGDSSGVASARSSLIYALVGLVVAALAQFIVHFVLAKV
jgi:type IV secretion system pilin